MASARRPAPGKRASRGYRSAQRLVAMTYKRVQRQRLDGARKWAQRVVRAHGAIAIEDFRPGFLARSSMARKAADRAISTTRGGLPAEVSGASVDDIRVGEVVPLEE